MNPRKPASTSRRLRLALAACTLVLGACVSVPQDERMLAPRADGRVDALSQPCRARAPLAAMPVVLTAGKTLDPHTLRLVSWNLHKGEDDGWQGDLRRFAAEGDLLLLQEAVLNAPVRETLERAGHNWRMAGAFAYNGEERGVLVAARAQPIDACTLRAFEPLGRMPKSAMVARYRLSTGPVLAVANLHGINFTLGLEAFGEQIEAVAEVMARHEGPAILGGDFNTWSDERHQALQRVAARLGMTPVELSPDGRRRTFGRHLDHLFVRGLRVVDAHAPEVTTSDHNPIIVTLSSP
ncbi:MAG: endonuclease/exonuclease/phosphatase family protein [Burkholderiaceae bacterium]